jgi:hypothetical protein
MHRRSRLSLFPLVVLLVAASGTVQAQLVTASPGVAVYRYAEPGQPTMDVKVWGAVRTPGIFQVELDSDLLDVLTLAGGPLYDREVPNVERTVTVRLSRGSQGARSIVFEQPLDDLVTQAISMPALQDGDVVSVEVDVRQRFGWRDGLTLLSTAGTVAVLVLNILRFNR